MVDCLDSGSFLSRSLPPIPTPPPPPPHLTLVSRPIAFCFMRKYSRSKSLSHKHEMSINWTSFSWLPCWCFTPHQPVWFTLGKSEDKTLIETGTEREDEKFTFSQKLAIENIEIRPIEPAITWASGQLLALCRDVCSENTDTRVNVRGVFLYSLET